MTIPQGAIVLVRFPFTDQMSSKVRPAVIVSGEVFNRGHDLLLVPITTHFHRSPFTLSLFEKDLSKGHLRKKSFIKCGHLTVFEKSLVQKTVAQLKPLKLKAILKLARTVFD